MLSKTTIFGTEKTSLLRYGLVSKSNIFCITHLLNLTLYILRTTAKPEIFYKLFRNIFIGFKHNKNFKPHAFVSFTIQFFLRDYKSLVYLVCPSVLIEEKQGV